MDGIDDHDDDFDAWMTEHKQQFDAEMREDADTTAVLRAIKHRAAEQVRTEIDNRVAMAVVTGGPRSPEPAWPAERWERIDDDVAKLDGAALQRWNGSFRRPVPLRPKRDESATWEQYGIEDGGELLNAGSQGQNGALLRIFALVKPLATRYTRAYVGMAGAPMELADDLAQQALMAMLDAAPDYQRQRDEVPFLQFAYTVIRDQIHVTTGGGKAVDWLAHLRGEHTDSSADSTEAGGDGIHLATLLRELKDRDREVIVLRVLVGLTVEETATALNARSGWVRVQQHRALQKLRKKASALDDQPG